ncbi:hypothetical protein UlMin_010085 [Ulmus minor]
MNAFREATNYCGLADLGFRGPKFTWNRGKNACLVQERLDRMLGNGGWLDLFPNSLVHHLNLRGSDHRPLLVELLRVDGSSSIGKIWKRGHFHFEEAWVDEVECSNLIKNHWRSSAAINLDGVANKLRLCRTLDALRYKEERYWKQRSKDLWLKCGDKNSKFFHQKAFACNSKKSITGLIDQNGKWCEEEEGLANIIESYFKSLFTSFSPSATNFDRLEQAFEAEDVRTAVFQMAPTKSPRADGILCNVLYKIISKMLANRLRKIMDTVISQEQSSFILGRLILDNAIIGFECLHAIKRQKTKKNYLALKLDIAKAYDRVEWGFIYKIMIKLGFSEVWTNKIMACLSSLLHHYEQSGDLQGLRCGLRGPTISHLFFSDGILLFIEAKTTACSALKEALNFYETASGQAVNLSKSAVCFGPNLPEADAVNLTACLGVLRVRCHEKYLGLPCYAGKNK